MICHIVMFRLGGSCDKAAVCREFKTAIERLPGVISALSSVRVDLNGLPVEGNWDMVLTAECAGAAELAEYAAHPAHVACVDIIRPYMAGRACVDVVQH